MAATLADQTYNALLTMILERKYAPGDRLPSEMALCEELHVSRNTLRGALNKLSVLGITETHQGGGTFIRKVDSDVYLNFFIPAALTHNMDLLELMEFRKGIEVEAAALAARYATDEDIAELRARLKVSRRGYEESMSAFASGNAGFHYSIAQASHNKLYEKMMKIVFTMILPEMQEFQQDQGEDVDSIFYHTMIVECIAAHKPEEASFFMQKHLSSVVERVRRYVERSSSNSVK